MEAQLPDELLLAIFEGLPQETLRNIRFLNRKWNAFSTPLIFERINTSLLPWSLAKLLALSQSPLAKYVKAIDFHTEQLREYDERWYRGALNYSYPMDEMKEGWKAFESCCQRPLRSHGQREHEQLEHGLELKDYVAKFCNLREVVADRVTPSGTSRIDTTAYWYNLGRTILIKPFVNDQMRDMVKDCHGGRPTFFLLEAIGHRSGIAGMETVESLTIEMPPFAFIDFIDEPERFFGRETTRSTGKAGKKPRYQAMVNIFKKLKHLVILCPGLEEAYGDERAHWNTRSEWQTKIFLEHATNFQSLELEIGEATRVPLQPDFTELQGHPAHEALLWLLSRRDTTYTHLREFKIGASSHPKAFTNFLSQHKSTLRRLKMKDCVSHNSKAVLAFIAQDLTLDHSRTRFLWMRKVTRKGTNEADLVFFDQALNEEAGVSFREMVDRIPDFGTPRWIRWEGKFKGYDSHHDDDEDAYWRSDQSDGGWDYFNTPWEPWADELKWWRSLCSFVHLFLKRYM